MALAARVRLETDDGDLIEGHAVSIGVDDSRRSSEGYSRLTVTFIAHTTTPNWRAEHEAGEDMGEPIKLPGDPVVEPASSVDPSWGMF